MMLRVLPVGRDMLSVRTSLNKIQHLQKTFQRTLCLKEKTLPTLTLYTKDVCPLCDDAKLELEPYKHRLTFEEVDIMAPENKKWLKYKYDIPVFHFNGKFIMKHRADTAELENALSDYELKAKT